MEGRWWWGETHGSMCFAATQPRIIEGNGWCRLGVNQSI